MSMNSNTTKEEIKIESSDEIWHELEILIPENKIYTELWDNLEIAMIITKSYIEFCNWVSRGLEHANLFIAEDESINNQIAFVKFHVDLEMCVVGVSCKFNVGILVDILYIKRFKKD